MMLRYASVSHIADCNADAECIADADAECRMQNADAECIADASCIAELQTRTDTADISNGLRARGAGPDLRATPTPLRVRDGV